MQSYRSAIIERSVLTFCVEGLEPREELLFKSYVRLLDRVTDQQWTYHRPSPNERVDLLVAAEGVVPSLQQDPKLPVQAMLRIANTGWTGHGMLAWPIRPRELEKELNRLGGQASTKRMAQDTCDLPSEAIVGKPAALDANIISMRLKQWPPARLLIGPGRIRLATLLTSRAMNLNELVHRSALPLSQCKAFVEDLQRANLLMLQTAAPQPTAHASKVPQKATQPGLLDRIRMRLGIKSGSH